MCSTKRKAEGESAEAPPPKHEKTEAPLPKHGKRLFIKAILHWVTEHGKNRQCEGTFLVDSGCTGAIMNSEFVFKHKLPWVKRSKPVRVTGADGSPIEGAGERYTTPLTMHISHHQEEISWEIGQLEEGISGYLPIEWLTKHNPEIDWETGVDQIHWALSYKIFPPPHSIPRCLRPSAYGTPSQNKIKRDHRQSKKEKEKERKEKNTSAPPAALLKQPEPELLFSVLRRKLPFRPQPRIHSTFFHLILVSSRHHSILISQFGPETQACHPHKCNHRLGVLGVQHIRPREAPRRRRLHALACALEESAFDENMASGEEAVSTWAWFSGGRAPCGVPVGGCAAAIKSPQCSRVDPLVSA
jgi:hypothetical protein